MFSELERGFGLDVVIWLQAHRHPLLDGLALVLHGMGQSIVLAGLVLLVYWRLDRVLGKRLVIAFLLSLLIVNGLKLVWMSPRPYQAFPERVTPIVTQTGYGIPSGHAFDAVFLWGYAALWTGRKWLLVLVGVYTLVISWSRLYSGVHYPQDVVIGAALGVVTLALYWRFSRPRTAVMPGYPH